MGNTCITVAELLPDRMFTLVVRALKHITFLSFVCFFVYSCFVFFSFFDKLFQVFILHRCIKQARVEMLPEHRRNLLDPANEALYISLRV